MMMEKAGECIRERAKDVADAVTGKTAMKRKKASLGRTLFLSCGGLALFAVGCWVGIHRKVAKACLLKEKMPKAPSWHVWCR